MYVPVQHSTCLLYCFELDKLLYFLIDFIPCLIIFSAACEVCLVYCEHNTDELKRPRCQYPSSSEWSLCIRVFFLYYLDIKIEYFMSFSVDKSTEHIVV